MTRRWHQVSEPDESGRLYLDGEPIHCGDGLELQGRDLRRVKDSDGEWEERWIGVDRSVRVRYDVERTARGLLHVLYIRHEGYTFKRELSPDLALRWPA